VNHRLVGRMVGAGMLAEWRQVLRAPSMLILAIVHALVLMSLVLLFGLTGSRAPVDLVMEDSSRDAQSFQQALAACHHSFALTICDASTAARNLAQARVSAVITIPHGFSACLAQRRPVAIRVDIDNVNADLSEDVRSALPSAIVAFGQARDPAGLTLSLVESDRIGHDTGFIPYLAVSAFALDLLTISAVLAAVAMCRDREARLDRFWERSPVHPGVLLVGRVLASLMLAGLAIMPALGLVLAIGIHPLHPWALAACAALILVCGCSLGVAVGAVIPQSTLAIALILGLSLALYLASGALEPQRFDGEVIWYLAHASPAYPAVALLEATAHGLDITPEPQLLNALSAVGWTLAALLFAVWRFPRRQS